MTIYKANNERVIHTGLVDIHYRIGPEPTDGSYWHHETLYNCPNVATAKRWLRKMDTVAAIICPRGSARPILEYYDAPDKPYNGFVRANNPLYKQDGKTGEVSIVKPGDEPIAGPDEFVAEAG